MISPRRRMALTNLTSQSFSQIRTRGSLLFAILIVTSITLFDPVDALVKELRYGKLGGLSLECDDDEIILVEKEELGFSRTKTCNPQPMCTVPYTQASWYCRGLSSCSGMQVERRPLHRRTCGSDFTNCVRVVYQCVKTASITNICSNAAYESHTGHVSSPRFPNVYPPRRNCSCTLTVSAGRGHIQLFTPFFLLKLNEPCRDMLTVQLGREGGGSSGGSQGGSEGGGSNGNIQGSSEGGEDVRRISRCGYQPLMDSYPASNWVGLNFRSDRTDQDMGFVMRFTGSTPDTKVRLQCGRNANKETAVTTTTTATATTATSASTRPTSTATTQISRQITSRTTTAFTSRTPTTTTHATSTVFRAMQSAKSESLNQDHIPEANLIGRPLPSPVKLENPVQIQKILGEGDTRISNREIPINLLREEATAAGQNERGSAYRGKHNETKTKPGSKADQNVGHDEMRYVWYNDMHSDLNRGNARSGHKDDVKPVYEILMMHSTIVNNTDIVAIDTPVNGHPDRVNNGKGVSGAAKPTRPLRIRKPTNQPYLQSQMKPLSRSSALTSSYSLENKPMPAEDSDLNMYRYDWVESETTWNRSNKETKDLKGHMNTSGHLPNMNVDVSTQNASKHESGASKQLDESRAAHGYEGTRARAFAEKFGKSAGEGTGYYENHEVDQFRDVALNKNNLAAGDRQITANTKDTRQRHFSGKHLLPIKWHDSSDEKSSALFRSALDSIKKTGTSFGGTSDNHLQKTHISTIFGSNNGSRDNELDYEPTSNGRLNSVLKAISHNEIHEQKDSNVSDQFSQHAERNAGTKVTPKNTIDSHIIEADNYKDGIHSTSHVFDSFNHIRKQGGDSDDNHFKSINSAISTHAHVKNTSITDDEMDMLSKPLQFDALEDLSKSTSDLAENYHYYVEFHNGHESPFQLTHSQPKPALHHHLHQATYSDSSQGTTNQATAHKNQHPELKVPQLPIDLLGAPTKTTLEEVHNELGSHVISQTVYPENSKSTHAVNYENQISHNLEDEIDQHLPDFKTMGSMSVGKSIEDHSESTYFDDSYNKAETRRERAAAYSPADAIGDLQPHQQASWVPFEDEEMIEHSRNDEQNKKAADDSHDKNENGQGNSKADRVQHQVVDEQNYKIGISDNETRKENIGYEPFELPSNADKDVSLKNLAQVFPPSGMGHDKTGVTEALSYMKPSNKSGELPFSVPTSEEIFGDTSPLHGINDGISGMYPSAILRTMTTDSTVKQKYFLNSESILERLNPNITTDSVNIASASVSTTAMSSMIKTAVNPRNAITTLSSLSTLDATTAAVVQTDHKPQLGFNDGTASLDPKTVIDINRNTNDTSAEIESHLDAQFGFPDLNIHMPTQSLALDSMPRFSEQANELPMTSDSPGPVREEPVTESTNMSGKSTVAVVAPDNKQVSEDDWFVIGAPHTYSNTDHPAMYPNLPEQDSKAPQTRTSTDSTKNEPPVGSLSYRMTDSFPRQISPKSQYNSLYPVHPVHFHGNNPLQHEEDADYFYENDYEDYSRDKHHQGEYSVGQIENQIPSKLYNDIKISEETNDDVDYNIHGPVQSYFATATLQPDVMTQPANANLKGTKAASKESNLKQPSSDINNATAIQNKADVVMMPSTTRKQSLTDELHEHINNQQFLVGKNNETSGDLNEAQIHPSLAYEYQEQPESLDKGEPLITDALLPVKNHYSMLENDQAQQQPPPTDNAKITTETTIGSISHPPDLDNLEEGWPNTYHVTQRLATGILKTAHNDEAITSQGTENPFSTSKPTPLVSPPVLPSNSIDIHSQMSDTMDAADVSLQASDLYYDALIVPARRSPDGTVYFKPRHGESFVKHPHGSGVHSLEESSLSGNNEEFFVPLIGIGRSLVGSHDGGTGRTGHAEAFQRLDGGEMRGSGVGSDFLGGHSLTWAILIVGLVGWIVFAATLGLAIYYRRKSRQTILYSSRSSPYSDFHVPTLRGLFTNQTFASSAYQRSRPLRHALDEVTSTSYESMSDITDIASNHSGSRAPGAAARLTAYDKKAEPTTPPCNNNSVIKSYNNEQHNFLSVSNAFNKSNEQGTFGQSLSASLSQNALPPIKELPDNDSTVTAASKLITGSRNRPPLPPPQISTDQTSKSASKDACCLPIPVNAPANARERITGIHSDKIDTHLASPGCHAAEIKTVVSAHVDDKNTNGSCVGHTSNKMFQTVGVGVTKFCNEDKEDKLFQFLSTTATHQTDSDCTITGGATSVASGGDANKCSVRPPVPNWALATSYGKDGARATPLLIPLDVERANTVSAGKDGVLSCGGAGPGGPLNAKLPYTSALINTLVLCGSTAFGVASQATLDSKTKQKKAVANLSDQIIPADEESSMSAHSSAGTRKGKAPPPPPIQTPSPMSPDQRPPTPTPYTSETGSTSGRTMQRPGIPPKPQGLGGTSAGCSRSQAGLRGEDLGETLDVEKVKIKEQEFGSSCSAPESATTDL